MPRIRNFLDRPRLRQHGVAVRCGLLSLSITLIGGPITPSSALAQRVPAHPPATGQRIDIAPGLHSRAAALRDPQFAVKAMQLTAAQTQALARINARYKPVITAYIATMNAALGRGIPDDSLRPMQDSLHHLLVAVRAAADSVITPAQRKQFQDAMRLVHAASLPPQGAVSASTNPSRLVPIPTGASRTP